MATLAYPGVYVEEVSSGVRPIAAAGTSTAAFIGMTEKGPDDDVKLITNWTQFQKYYGTFLADSYLAHSVFQFFNNGGSQCYIARVSRPDATTAGVTLQNRAPVPQAQGIKFFATSKGDWGNFLYLQIENGSKDPGNSFKITIRKQEIKDVIPEDFLNISPVEVHDNLSMDPNSPNYVVTALKSRSNLIAAVVSPENNSLQQGFYRGGLGALNPPTAMTEPKFRINIDNDGFQTVVISAPTSLDDAVSKITAAVQALTPLKASTPAEAFTGFTCVKETVDGKYRLLLTSGSTASDKSSVQVLGSPVDNAAGSLKLGEAYGGMGENALAVRRPALAGVVQLGDAKVAAPVTAVTAGSDGIQVLTEIDYAAVFSRLDKITDFSLLAVPGIGTTTMMDLGMGYCAGRTLQDVFYIGEMSQDDDTPEEASTFRKLLTQSNSYGALYYPWIKSLDPAGKSSEPILLPPSGYLAGLFARTDNKRGVWKAPAGTEATLNGTVGLAMDLTDVEQGNLNNINVNCIRRFAGTGIVSWGARTITADPEWNYIPVRRMAMMLRVSIYNGIQWAIFEPNDEELWSQLRLNLTSFMMTLFRQGAFQGTSPDEAFFVKCDNETTTQDDINLGIVNVSVGFAPLKPAEFVVVKISQKAGQTS
jgi:hypothetical protein